MSVCVRDDYGNVVLDGTQPIIDFTNVCIRVCLYPCVPVILSVCLSVLARVSVCLILPSLRQQHGGCQRVSVMLFVRVCVVSVCVSVSVCASSSYFPARGSSMVVVSVSL